MKKHAEKSDKNPPHPVLPRAGVDAGDPQRPHVALLGPAVPRRVLQGLLDALARDANAVACPAAEARREPEHGLLVHRSSFFLLQEREKKEREKC